MTTGLDNTAIVLIVDDEAFFRQVIVDALATDDISALEAASGSELDDELPIIVEPAVHHKLLTWRNSLLGGGLAMVFLAIVTAGFMYMRSSGIGPVGSLVAKGLIDERSEIMVADFEAEDDMLGRMASEALRVDLSQSDIVRLVNPRTVEGALRRMQVPEGTRIDWHRG